MRMTAPVVHLGGEGETTSIEPDHPYRKVLRVYGIADTSDTTANSLPVIEGNASERAGHIVRDLLSISGVTNIASLVDCRSSTMVDGVAPTYRLAAVSGLVRSLCWSISGQGGTEVAEAIAQLGDLSNGTAVVSATQLVQQPDVRSIEGRYPLGDASTAVLLAEDECLAQPSWEVLGTAFSHTSDHDGIYREDISSVIATLDSRAREAGVVLQWAIGQHSSTEFLDDVKGVLPTECSLHRRSAHSEINFGCADCLATLSELQDELKGTGIVLFSGRFGAVAGVLFGE